MIRETTNMLRTNFSSNKIIIGKIVIFSSPERRILLNLYIIVAKTNFPNWLKNKTIEKIKALVLGENL
jgi:hypothetical protein